IHVAQRRELGEFTVIHALTGWLPEVIPLHPGYVDRVWELLKELLPEFKLTEDPSSESKITMVDNKLKEPGKEMKDVKEVKDGKEVKEVKDFKPESSLTTLKAPEKSAKGSSAIPSPQMVVYATFTPLYLFENKIFTLEKMANSAEKLREYGLSHICSHPVLVTRSRSCPLVAPPKPPPLPPWKLIRHKKEMVITDEAQGMRHVALQSNLHFSGAYQCLPWRMVCSEVSHTALHPKLLDLDLNYVFKKFKYAYCIWSGGSTVTVDYARVHHVFAFFFSLLDLICKVK
ncbi:ADGB, partial [Lemmus lemmus]